MRSTDHPDARARVAIETAAVDVLARYRALRRATEALTRSLTPEDMGAQSMPDASPTKWHLAHTTWFFETFMLVPHLAGYRSFDPKFGYLFNSYYEAVGPRQPRPARGLITRPSVADVLAYRAHVDAGMRPTTSSRQLVVELIRDPHGLPGLTAKAAPATSCG